MVQPLFQGLTWFFGLGVPFPAEWCFELRPCILEPTEFGESTNWDAGTDKAVYKSFSCNIPWGCIWWAVLSLINSFLKPLVSQALCSLTTTRALCLGHKLLLCATVSEQPPSYGLLCSRLDRNIIRAVDEIYQIVPPWPQWSGNLAESYLSPT